MRGTHFGVIAQNGHFLDVAVTVDTKPHISRVEVFDLKMDKTFDVVEDKQLTFQGKQPEIIPVTEKMNQMAAKYNQRPSSSDEALRMLRIEKHPLPEQRKLSHKFTV